jgi:hypothetical protein
MNDSFSKKEPKSYPSIEAGRADVMANAVDQAKKAVEETKREREAALARCVESGDVPTPDDVERIRHLFIRLDRRIDGQRLLDKTRRKMWRAIRRLLVRWEDLGAVNVDPIRNNCGGGEWETWKAIQRWAEKEHDRRANGGGTSATLIADQKTDEGKTETVESRALAYLVANFKRKLTKKAIALAVECHPKTLSPQNAPKFDAAWRASRNYPEPPRGTKSKYGDVEAESGPYRGRRADDDD